MKMFSKGIAVAGSFAGLAIIGEWLGQAAGLEKDPAAVAGGALGLAGSMWLLWWFKSRRRQRAAD